ncbi:MAG: AAA family ATPase [Nitrososphaerales archaeon]
MMLKKLMLQNFRSYGSERTTVEFAPGVLLFEGEIGSGKSSILYAVEFALFGLGELESKYLIRGSENSTRVELDFQVGGQDYKVTRTIEKRKGKGKQIQTKGWIEEPDGRETEYPPTELRSRILQILNFREKQGSKASSRIYRYAIFTPQELMKEVLTQSPEERIDTLRRAFGVEDYSFAGSNTDLVAKRLNDIRRTYAKLSEGVQEKEGSLDHTKSALSKYEEQLEKEKGELAEVEERIKEARASLEVLELESKKVTQLQILIPQLENGLRVLKLQAVEVKRELERQTRTLGEIQRAEGELSVLRAEYEDFMKSRERLRELATLQDERLSVESQISRLEASVSSKEKSLSLQIASLGQECHSLEEKIKSYDKQELSLAELEQSANQLRKKKEELPIIQARSSELSSKIGATSAIIASHQTELGEARERIEKLGDLTESECPLCGQKLDSDHMTKVREEFDQKITDLDLKINESNEKLRFFKEEARELETQKNSYLADQRQLEEIETQISRGDISSLREDAKQRLEQLGVQRNGLVLKLDQRQFASEEEKELKEAFNRRERLAEPLSEFARLEASVRKFEDAGKLESFQRAKIAVSKKEEIINSISSQSGKSMGLEEEVSKRASEIEVKKRDLEDSEPVMLKFAKTKAEVDLLSDQRSEIKQSTAVLSKEIESQNKEIQRLENEIKKLRENEAKASLYRGISSWLEEHFLPAVKDIESYVFSSINEDFNKLLQQFFSILVEEGDFTTTVDDSFSPVVEQGGYELDVQSLSGGERTAIALAYRLAMNYMVKRANEAMHANLLILDEPTEGFSKEQIYKLRNVLDELNCEQVIIVSHERDLEAMADRVYRVEKINGESFVSLAN